MCFSAPMSAFLAAATLLGGAYLHRSGTRMGVVQLFYCFGLMEVLQLAQWFVVADGYDACAAAGPANQVLTLLSWIHVSFQPLSMNAYLFTGPGHMATPEGAGKRAAVLRLCAASALFTLARAPHFSPFAALSRFLPGWDAFAARYLPELPTAAMAGRACGRFDAMCGQQLCTYVPSSPSQGGSGHLAWSLPLLPSSYFSPNSALHFFVFFMPGLVLGRHLVDRLMIPVLLLSGPLVSMWLSASPAASGRLPASYAHEWPSVWCMLSVAQVALALLREAILAGGKSGKAAAAARRRQQQQQQGGKAANGAIDAATPSRAGLRRRA
jgi:hypothetical protein